MPKKTIKRVMPSHEQIKAQKFMRIFGNLLHDGNLWHLNRRSASGAFAVGFFWAFIPVPIQMYLSAFTAIIFRVNLPLSVGLVWITNPITMPPMFYFCYLVGTWVTGNQPQGFKFELSFEWLANSINSFGPTFLIGCVICAVIASITSYFMMQWLWIRSVKSDWKKRSFRDAND